MTFLEPKSDGDRRRSWILPTVVGSVVLCLILAFAGVLGASMQGRLDVNIGQPSTAYELWSGTRTVKVLLRPHGDDNGDVMIIVEVDHNLVANTLSYYDYDLFANQPAGTWEYRWIDADLWPDLVIMTSTTPAESFYVGSRDGQVYVLP